MTKCEECGSTKYLQIHHISYTPQILQTLCVTCHIAVHNHGTGRPHDPTRKSNAIYTETVVSRITTRTKTMIQDVILKDTHLNESDFLRSAIREKIINEAPDLYNEMMKQPSEGTE